MEACLESFEIRHCPTLLLLFGLKLQHCMEQGLFQCVFPSVSIIVLPEVATLYEHWLFQCDSILRASTKEGERLMHCLVCEVSSHHLTIVDSKSGPGK